MPSLEIDKYLLACSVRKKTLSTQVVSVVVLGVSVVT
jgi:hypothetical protein